MNNIFSTPVAIGILTTGILLVGTSLYLFYCKSSRRSNKPDKFDELYKRISEEIKYAVAPKSINLSASVTELIELATEVWRIEQRLAKVTDILPENQRKGLENSVHKFKRYISNYDIEIVDYTNQKFNDGLNLDVLSVEKDQSVTTPTVKETVEPTILVKGQVVKKAKIVLLSN
jgi:molecular chaperone GrpE (heat shock protein)